MVKLIYLGQKNEIYIPSLNIRSVRPGVPFEAPESAVEALLKNEGFEKFVEKVSNVKEEKEGPMPEKKSKAKASKIEKGE